MMAASAKRAPEIRTAALEELERDLESDEEHEVAHGRSSKRVQLHKKRLKMKPFREKEHNFKITTFHIKSLGQTFEMMRESEALVNLHVGNSGVKLFSLPSSGTVCVLACLNRTYFSSYEFKGGDQGDIVLPLNISVLHGNMQRFQEFNIQALTFASGNGHLSIVGVGEREEKTDPIMAQITCACSPLQEVNVNWDYPVMFRVNSSKFATNVNAMPTEFQMRMVLEKKILQFEGQTEIDRFVVSLRIPDAVIAKMEEFEESINHKKAKTVGHFEAFFRKAAFQPILKAACRFNPELTIAFAQDRAFMCQIMLKEGVEDKDSSKITVWICPKIKKAYEEDEEDSEEEEEEDEEDV